MRRHEYTVLTVVQCFRTPFSQHHLHESPRTEQHARLRYVKAYYDGRTDPLVQTVPAKSSSSSSATNSSASSADPEGVAGER